MISLFLRAKHWQLFLFTCGLPVILVVALMINIYSGNDGEYPDPFLVMVSLSSAPILLIIFLVAIFGWQWAVVIGLHKKIPAEAKFSLIRFKVLFFIPIVYIMIFTTLMGMIMLTVFTTIAGIDQLPDAISTTRLYGLVAIALCLHVLSILCIIHSLYFAAKTLKTVELQRKVSFSECIEEFLLIWFYPIGIWILQPKINAWIRE